MTIIANQRHLFDIPDDVTFLNCAYMSPLMKPVQDAGIAGIRAKARPWNTSPEDFFTYSEATRTLFADLISAPANNIAIVPSVSYGLATAARNLTVRRDQEIVLLEDQFPSNVYVWRKLADDNGAHVRTVRRAEAATGGNRTCDWTRAVLSAIGDQTAIVALPHCHWTDGTLIDLAAVGAAARARGAALVLDVTQSCGALPFDVGEVRPDFLICACYKWLLGPYALGFLYAADKYHGGEALEQGWITRQKSEDFANLVDYQDGYQPGARRFDMGERSNFQLMPMADAALRQILDWGVENIAETLGAMTTNIAERGNALGLRSAQPGEHAGHFLGLRFTDGIPDGFMDHLKKKNIFVSVRGDSVRVTPHLYNTQADIDRFFAALETVL